MNRETTLWKIIARRLKSARGAVLLEFGCIAPLFMYAFLWAADFSQTLYTEQQLDIASRFLCDVEAHLMPGARTGYGTIHTQFDQTSGRTVSLTSNTSGCPGQPGKTIVRKYLAEVLKFAEKDENDKIVTGEGRVFCRGYFYLQEGALHTALNTLSQHSLLGLALSSIYTGGSDAVKDLIAAFDRFAKRLQDFLTFRENRYLDNIIPTDKVVATSVSVKSKPLIRGYHFNVFGSHASDQSMMLVSYENVYVGGKLVEDERRRHYYYMPSFDTAPQAQYTYARSVTSIFKNWVK